MLPRLTQVHQDDTHRLIPAKYAEREQSVLRRIARDEREVHDLFELDSATNERLLGESNLLPGITVHELVFGVPHYHIVNAAFTHAQPNGSRFNGPERGAWYAGFALETAQAEVAYHFGEELREIPSWQAPETRAYRDYLADFRGEFHDIRSDERHSACLDPKSYRESQRLARELLNQGSAGIIYPSVRHPSGTCIGCFRPALVTNVREGGLTSISFPSPNTVPAIHVAEKL
ncbi:MAG TPA: RES family NAD+ phosphorylase [Terriglobales bacterium]